MKAEEQLKQFKLELADLMDKYDTTIWTEITEGYVETYIECNPTYNGNEENLGFHLEYVGQYISSETLREK